jgi:putative peptide zinc metalloprotease protein
MTSVASPNALPDTAPLPQIREDLQVMQGSELVNGAPSWLIFDPARHKYFQIGKTMFCLLSHWDVGTVGKLKAESSIELERSVEDADISALIKFLSAQSLLVQPAQGNHATLYAMAKAGEQGWFAWAVHHYLFFRIPLMRPQKFLEATKGFAQIIASKPFVLGVLLLTILGLYGVSRQWDTFLATFLHFISWEGAIYYAISLGVVKTAHELGHAYMAVRYNTRVNTIGLAFLVMMPVLYTDVSDSWRLRSRRERLMIDCAGIFVELMLAGIATFLWAFLPDGPLRSICFTIATTSWLMSVALNLNPMMRFDGYYILSDWLGVPNLQARSFAFGRWALREKLFKLQVAPPEAMPAKLRLGLITYAWCIWVYRAVVFAGIAVLVYYMFFKLLGLILFLIEITWFLALPAYSEMKEWWKMRNSIQRTRRSMITGCVALGAIVLLVLPLQTNVDVPAVLTSRREMRIFTPMPAEISQIHVVDGAKVQAGDVLFTLHSPDIRFELKRTQMKIDVLQNRLGRQTADKQDRAAGQVLLSELVSEQSKLLGLQIQLSELQIKAPFAGVVSDIDASLHKGRWINQKSMMALLVARENLELRGYVREVDLERIKSTSEGLFVPEDAMQKSFKVSVNTIAYAASDEIDIPYLSSANGGRVAVNADTTGSTQKKAKPVGANYLVTMTPLNMTHVESTQQSSQALVGQALVGIVHLSGQGESIAGQLARQIMKVLVREAGA